MPSDSWQAANRVLAICTDSPDEVIAAAPAVRTLRRGLPHTHLALLIVRSARQAASLIPGIDEVLISDNGMFDPELIHAIHARRYDAAVIFTARSASPHPAAYACYLAGIRIRIGQSREFGGQVLSQWVKPLPAATLPSEHHLHLLYEAGFTEPGPGSALRVPRDAQEAANTSLRLVGLEPDAPFVLASMNAVAEHDRLLARTAGARFLAAFVQRPVLLASSSWCEAPHHVLIGAQPDGSAIAMTTGYSLVEYAAIVRRTELIVSRDAVTQRLAEAFGRRVVALPPLVASVTPNDLERTCRSFLSGLCGRDALLAPVGAC